MNHQIYGTKGFSHWEVILKFEQPSQNFFCTNNIYRTVSTTKQQKCFYLEVPLTQQLLGKASEEGSTHVQMEGCKSIRLTLQYHTTSLNYQLVQPIYGISKQLFFLSLTNNRLTECTNENARSHFKHS